MNAYSEDLRKKIVEAAERGAPKTEVARAFGVGISSVKWYVATARDGHGGHNRRPLPGINHRAPGRFLRYSWAGPVYLRLRVPTSPAPWIVRPFYADGKGIPCR